jgi:hypothetical protein
VMFARVYVGRVRKRDNRRQKTRERALFVNTEEARARSNKKLIVFFFVLLCCGLSFAVLAR